MDDPANSMVANMRRAGEFCKPAGVARALTIYIVIREIRGQGAPREGDWASGTR